MWNDTHFTTQIPTRRLDDYLAAQINKAEQVVEIANSNNVDLITHAGDVFDNPRVSFEIVQHVIGVFHKFKAPMLAVVGQHDITGHNIESYKRSPVAVLEQANVLKLLSGSDPIILGDIHVYGCSFGDKIPKPQNKEAYNILVLHGNISYDKNMQSFAGSIDPKQMLSKHKTYDVIHCGDYHYPFYVHAGKRAILNAGSLMRKSISEQDMARTPQVVIWDTNSCKETVVELKVENLQDILDMKETSTLYDSSLNADILAFAQELQSEGASNHNWRTTLRNVLEKNGTSSSVETRLNEIISDCCVRES